MIDRYTRPEMGRVWTQENRFQAMLEVEQAVAEAQAELGLIPKEAALAIRKKGRFELERINELEKTTKHDVIAFVSSVAENVGPLGRYVHFGMTSSDVLDTAMSLLVRDAAVVLRGTLKKLETTLHAKAVIHASTLCAGRTHGMHAEPTSFGLKLAGFLAELKRNQERLERAFENMRVGKLSGAVGTYSTQDEAIETLTCKKLNLRSETIATQVVPRDRHAELFSALALFGAGIERMAVEFRHLQRTEVGEVVEGFTPGQKGSSAMPHKKNPISAENLTGCARLLRAYAQAAFEDVALWHERDISHSAVERVIFPDAFILADYAGDRLADLVDRLYVNSEAMLHNMELSQGQLFSSHLLLALVEKGWSREDAYAKVQELSHALRPGEQLRDKVKNDRKLKNLLSAKEIDAIFSGDRHRQSILKVLARVGIGTQNSTEAVVRAKPPKAATSGKKKGQERAKR